MPNVKAKPPEKQQDHGHDAEEGEAGAGRALENKEIRHDDEHVVEGCSSDRRLGEALSQCPSAAGCGEIPL